MMLITLLRTIACIWNDAKVAESAQRVGELGRELYERLVVMTDHFAKLGDRLDGAVQEYNKTVGSNERPNPGRTKVHRARHRAQEGARRARADRDRRPAAPDARTAARRRRRLGQNRLTKGDERRSFPADKPSGMTAAAPVPSEGRRPLGEVLVDRGIVTPEQLTTALEQQRSTGKQLGEIIVRARSFAPGPIVAQALATQHGGMMKTEYGFAMGWSSDDAPALVAPPVQVDPAELAKRDATIAELRAWAETGADGDRLARRRDRPAPGRPRRTARGVGAGRRRCRSRGCACGPRIGVEGAAGGR